MSYDGYCIECGAMKIHGDLDYEKWGGEDIGGGWVLLCPVHYKKHLEEVKQAERNHRHYAFVIKQLKKVFPKAIEWAEGVSYQEGYEMSGKMINSNTYNRLRNRMEKIIKAYNEKMDKSPLLPNKIKEHIKKILFDKCYVCCHWDENNYCNKLNNSIYDIMILGWNKGNFSCQIQDILLSSVITSTFDDEDLFRKKINEWLRDNTGLNK